MGKAKNKVCATCTKSLLGNNFELIRPKFSRSKKPDYSKMFQECLNIQLQINEKMDSICSSCIKNLHCAAAFRSKVIKAQNLLSVCEESYRYGHTYKQCSNKHLSSYHHHQEIFLMNSLSKSSCQNDESGSNRGGTVVKPELHYEELIEENEIDDYSWHNIEIVVPKDDDEELGMGDVEMPTKYETGSIENDGTGTIENDEIRTIENDEIRTIENDETKYIQSLIQQSDTLIQKARGDDIQYLTAIPKLEQMAEDDIYIIEKATSDDDAYNTDMSAEYLEDEERPQKKTRKRKHVKSIKNYIPQNREALIRRITKKPKDNRQPTLKELVPEGVTSCHICDKEFPNTFLVKRHMSSVHYPQHMCAVCGLGYYNASSLKSHMFTHTSATYSCNYCDRVFASKHTRGAHVRFVHTHVGEFYKCRECSARFATEGQRRTHMRADHQMVKRHKCDVCGKQYFSSSQCKAHYRRIHLRLRNHACEYCARTFWNKGELVWHLADAHGVGENPKCPVCKKSFGLKNSLNLHIQLKHPDYTRPTCQLCGIQCNTERALQNHLNSTIHRSHFRLQNEMKDRKAAGENESRDVEESLLVEC